MISLLVSLAAATAVAAGLYALWARRVRAEIAEGAGHAFERISREEPHLVAGVGRARFGEIYGRVMFPRFPKYFLISVAAFVAVLPVVLALLTGALYGLERAGLIAEPAELARFVPMGEARTAAGQEQREEMALYLARDYAGFYYFFGVIAGWIAVLAVTMREYHRRRPGDLREELIRAREGASEPA
ncbi:MAG: hypothetical protein AAFX08_05630 [Pseudomonadota bacterium]